MIYDLSSNSEQKIYKQFEITDFFAILGTNCTVSIDFDPNILPNSREMILDYQLNSLVENCLKTIIVGFGSVSVFGLKVGRGCNCCGHTIFILGRCQEPSYLL